jgi:hypothetical protein
MYSLINSETGDSRSYFVKNGTTQMVIVRSDPKPELLESEFKIEESDDPSFKQLNVSIIDKHLLIPVRIIVVNDAATEIKRLTEQSYIEETYESYLENVYPFIKDQPIEWMENLIFKFTEEQEVYYRDDDIVIARDMTWDGKISEKMHILTMVTNRNLKSIRDLNDSHLELLEKIKKKTLNVALERYGISSDKIRCYFHYHPSYWWLHIHFTHMNVTYGCSIDRGIELNQVIQNIKLIPDYYQKASLKVIRKIWTVSTH